MILIKLWSEDRPIFQKIYRLGEASNWPLYLIYDT
jgi:hypothetical protein